MTRYEFRAVDALRAKQGRVIDGVVRSPGHTFQDVRACDPNPGSDEVWKEFTDAGDKFTVPNSWFFSEEIAKLESEKLWSNSWVFACREERIPEVGSCYVHDFLDHSVLIVREQPGRFKAFRNTCRHRGNQLRLPGSCGTIGKFFCPFHGASWNLDGTLSSWPAVYDFPRLEKEDYGLEEVALGVFEGFIFINMAKKPIPFEEYLDPMPKLFDGIPYRNRSAVLHVRKELRGNWKLARQAFCESLHNPVVHPQAKTWALSAGSQIDVPGKFVRRLISAIGITTDQTDKDVSERDRIRSMAQGLIHPRPGLSADDVIDALPDDITAREFLADAVSQNVLAETGVDVRAWTTAAIIDNVIIHLFPAFWTGLEASGPFSLSVLPGATPDACLLDVILYKEIKEGARKPPYPDRIDIGADQTWEEGMPNEFASFGLVADQDTGNIEGQQRGLRASPDGHCVFANYCESMIIRDMLTWQEMLGLPAAESRRGLNLREP